ncbi:MAG: hypothetical protein Kow00124_12300 [Anaerolineae bacterium]
MGGQQIGQYRLVGVIGQGGMATVYRAYQPSVDRDVAIKALPRKLSEDPNFLRRYRHEARVIARLEHRSILPVYDYGEADGVPFIVMRLLEGGTLRDALAHGPIDLDLAVRIMDQVSEALDYAHSRGVIHRDLKPSNILFDERQNAYLTDFGIAKILGEASQITAEGVIGTPSYMSPEQCQGKELTPASDLYALGVILFEMLTGRPPYQAETPLAVMYMHVRDAVPSICKIDPSLPPALDRVIARVLAKRPERRYPSAQALAADFKRAIRGWHRTASPPVAGAPAPAQTPEEMRPHPRPVRTARDKDGLPHGVRRQAEAPSQEKPSRGTRQHRLSQVATSVLGLVLLIGAVGAAVLFLPRGGQPAPAIPIPTLPGSSAAIPTTGSALPGTGESSPTATPTQPTGIILESTGAAPDTPAPASTMPPPAPLSEGSTPGLLAFTQGFGDAAEIAVIGANGEGYRLLTQNTWYDGEPDWSPDGTRIVFESARAGNRDLVIISADGENSQQLTSSPVSELHPDWSPDGLLVVFEASDGQDSELYLIDSVGGAPVRLTDNNYDDRAPQFSPDGRWIAYMTRERGVWEIALLSYPEGVPAGIIECPAAGCRFPSWSPDTTRLAFNTIDEEGGLQDIWVVELSSRQAMPVTQGGEDGRPVWSGDGQYIYFNRTRGEMISLYRVAIGSGTVEQITSGDVQDYAPDWGPAP